MPYFKNVFVYCSVAYNNCVISPTSTLPVLSETALTFKVWVFLEKKREDEIKKQLCDTESLNLFY